MTSIFFDLETTDQSPIGQILNYSFITVNKQFEIVSELSDLIQISPIELPRAGAILANRVNVLEQQKEAKDSELAAMTKIAEYIKEITEQNNGKVHLIGYNSSRFDIPYLRTSMIRNGINPYFNGKLLYRDLLFAARKLSVSHPDFPRVPIHDATTEEQKNKLSLKLETLTKELGLLSGKQTHESRDDVVLTIKLAQKLLNDFDLDIRTYEPYEAKKIHFEKDKSRTVAGYLSPEYDLTTKKMHNSKPMALLNADSKASLWIDLNKYEETGEKDAIYYFNLSSHAFYLDEAYEPNDKDIELSQKAQSQFSELTLRNYFTAPSCDIEQHIYRLSFNYIDTLYNAITSNDKRSINEIKKNKDAHVLYIRSKLRNSRDLSNKNAQKLAALYADYRYGGKLQLSKTISDKDEKSERDFSPSLEALYDEIKEKLVDAPESDLKLLTDLKKYYDNSFMTQSLST